jgi:hypothetical protein
VNELFFESLGHTVGFVFRFPRAIKTSSNLTEGFGPSFQYIRILFRMSAKISVESIVSYMNFFSSLHPKNPLHVICYVLVFGTGMPRLSFSGCLKVIAPVSGSFVPIISNIRYAMLYVNPCDTSNMNF